MKDDVSKKKFEVRSRQFKALGVFTEADLIGKILGGKFTGEEDVREVLEADWQKLAAHPRFYDAFLRRLFGSQYQVPSFHGQSKVSHDPESENKEAQTRQLSQAAERPEPASEPSIKTRQLGGKPANGNTVQQSDIDALFSNGGSKSGSRSRKTPLVLKQPVSETPDDKLPLLQPSQTALATRGEDPEFEFAAQPTRVASHGRRRKVLISSIAALCLVGLVSLMGEPEAVVETETEWESIRREALDDNTAKDDKVKSLQDEALDLMHNDSELFYKGASQVLAEALSWDPQNFSVLTQLALAYSRTLPIADDSEGLRKRISEWVAQARQQDPHSSVLYRVESIVALFEGDLEKAKQFALSAAETDPNSAENYLLVGELHYQGGAIAEARTVLEDSVRADPNHLRSRYYLARTALELKDYRLAQEQALEALKLNPLHPRSYMVLAMVAMAAGQTQDAKGLLESCGRLARFSVPDVAAQAYFHLGQLQERQGGIEQARKSYRLSYFYSSSPGKDLKAKVAGLNLDAKELESLALEMEYRAPYFAEQAEGLIRQRKIREALRFYQAAALLDHENPKRLLDLGDATERTADSYDDFRRVMLYYQRAIRQNPRNADAYIRLGLLETEQYGFERAFKLLNQALLLDPESAAPHIALGKYFYKKQDIDESLNEFLKAAQLDPANSEVLYYAGLLRLKFRKGGEKEADSFFYKAYVADPQNTEALAAWVRLKAANHDRTFAIKFVSTLLEKEPESPDLHWAMGEVYAASSEYRRAIGHYKRALDLDNRSSRVRMSLARALEAVGQFDKAVAEYRMSALLDRRNADGFYRAADLLFQMRKYNQAEEVLNFLASLAPTYPGVHEYLSRIHLLKKQDEKAISEMEKEVANNPQNYRYVLQLSELYMQFQKYDNAIRELSKVTNLPSIKKAPEFRYEKIRAYLLLARCYKAQTKLEGAEGAIKLAIELDPTDPELQRELGYVYYAQQRDKEGAEIFEKYLKQNPNARDTAAVKGMLQKMRIEQ
jgi:tetratricopeptide (TPR) repeat protein